MAEKENVDPDILSKRVAELSIDDNGHQNAHPSAVDESVSSASSTTIQQLPIELWIKIVEFVLMDGSGDKQFIRLSRLIRLSHISQYYWYARLNKYLYAGIDMASGFLKDKQADVLSAYMNCITNKTKFIRFGDSGPKYEAATLLIDNILSTCGDKASRVEFLGGYSHALDATLSSSTVDVLSKLGRLSHLEVWHYRIAYPTIVRNLIDRPSADQLVTLDLEYCPNIDDEDIHRNCKNLTNLNIEEGYNSHGPTDSHMSIDWDDIILHLPHLQHVSVFLKGSIEINFGGRSHAGKLTDLRSLNLSAQGGVTWKAPLHEFLRLCPYLDDINIWSGGYPLPTLNVTALFDGCTNLTNFSMDCVNLTVTPLTTWPPMLEGIDAVNTDCVEFLYAIGNMAKRRQDDGHPVVVSRLQLESSSSTAASLRICLTHMPMLTRLSLLYHKSIVYGHRRVYNGREEIEQLLGVLDTIYVDEEDAE